LTMLYRPTDRLRRRGAPVQNLAHSASFHSKEKIAPSKSGIKQVASRSLVDSGMTKLPYYHIGSP
jgi:hypothetical protein